MPVKSTRFKTQTIFDGEITGLNEREKNVFRKAGIGIGGTPENVLVAPTGLTKTELVGVGTNGQENIEIGDNLTLANGKLSAIGGGGDTRNVLVTTDMRHYTGTIDPNKDNVLIYNEKVYQIVEIAGSDAIAISGTEYQYENHLFEIYLLRDDGSFYKKEITKIYSNGVYQFYHFITIMNRENDIVNVALSTSKYRWNMRLDDLLDYMTDSENIRILATGYIGGNPVQFVAIDYSSHALKAFSYDTTNKKMIETIIDNSYRFTDIRGEAPR